MGYVSSAMMQAHCAELVRRDRTFNAIVKAAPLCPFGRVRPKTTHFESVVRAIIAQQVSTAAARTITERMRVIAGGAITPEALTRLSDPQLQSAGLTGAKVRSLAELSHAAAGGSIDFRRIARQPDDVVVAELSNIYGIGIWTAQMFLMFQLGRIDVWPTGDLAVRRGWDVLHQEPAAARDTAPSPVQGSTGAGVSARELDRLGDSLTGLRSVAAWYCWRAA
ncbi:MAG: DNA-3-methyladenine glycosylase 2 family protein [Actinobacteria bacterium]|nr:DNA-3-methyladenine glycosylase 2 family protein [Actinomycetota bacterium]